MTKRYSKPVTGIRKPGTVKQEQAAHEEIDLTPEEDALLDATWDEIGRKAAAGESDDEEVDMDSWDTDYDL